MKMKNLIIVLVMIFACTTIRAQNCDPSTPVFNVNLAGQPNGTWISPNSARLGYCCGITSGADQCIQFNLTLDPTTTAINFDIYSGAVPGGAMFYQINCGPAQAVGQPVCLTGPGPFIITFCKPGNNANQYAITSIAEPALNGTRYVSQSCQGTMIASGLTENTIQWTSVPSNATYNSYLSCTSGCDSVTISPPPNFSGGYIDYQVCGSVIGGCAVLPFCDTIRVNFVNDLAVNITPVNPTICYGGTSATVTANPTGGLPPYNYNWSTGETTQSITVGVGTYSVNITDQMNCSVANDSVVVTALPSPISCSAGSDATLCLNQQAYLLSGNVVAATGGLWSGGGSFIPSATTLNPEYYPSATEISNGAVDIRLVTTGNFNCPADTDYIHLTISPNPAPQINGPPQAYIYETGHYTTTLVNNDTYQWSVTGGVIVAQNTNSIDVKWTSAGTNEVRVLETNVALCDSLDIFPVIVSPKPTPVITGAITVCTNGTELYSVQNQVVGNNYQWSMSNGFFIDSTSNPVSVFWNIPGSGNVSVTETNVYGCDSAIALTINITPQPDPVISGDSIVCNYQTSFYSTPYYSSSQYNWTVTNGNILSQGVNSIEVYWNTIGTGTITLTEINQAFCDSTTTYNVRVLAQPVPVVNGPQSVCSRAVTNYFVSGVSNTESISWSIVGGLIMGPTSNSSIDVVWFNAGVGQLRVQVMNLNGCDSVITYVVNILEGTQPEMKGPARSCLNDTCVYSVGEVQGHIYYWQVQGGNVVMTNGNRITVCWQTVGTGNIILTEQSPSGCDSTISMSVTVDPLPLATANGIPIVCQGESSAFFTNAVLGNTYQWSLSGGNVIGSATQSSVTGLWSAIGQFNVTLIETNQYGCMTRAILPIQVVAKPNVNIAGNGNGCLNSQSTFTITQTAGTIYQYSVSGGYIISQNNGSVKVQWLSYGTHILSVSAVNNQTGCTAQNTFAITVAPLPPPVVNASSFSGCPPLDISFYNNADSSTYHYTWDFGEGSLSFEANPTHEYTSSGMYPVKVTVTNNSGCKDSANATVNVFPGPHSDFQITNNSRKIYADYEQLKLNNSSTGATSYLWDFGNGDISNLFEPTLTYNTPGNYEVTLNVVNAWGCVNISKRMIEVIVPENVFIPNAFTPNGDLKNDFFSVKFNNIVEAHIYIYNRWGELIYQTDDMDFKWDGKCGDREIQNDVYVYKIDAVGYYGTQIEKVGRISILY